MTTGQYLKVRRTCAIIMACGTSIINVLFFYQFDLWFKISGHFRLTQWKR